MRSKKSGSTSRTHSTMREITSAVSRGVSPECIRRARRCRVMPEMVCTMDVNAPTGIT